MTVVWKPMSWEDVERFQLEEFISEGYQDLDEWMAAHAAFDDYCASHEVDDGE